MRKERKIELNFYKARRTPPFKKEDYESGEALRMVVDWKERDINQYCERLYIDKEGNIYRIERYMTTSKEKIAEMMLMENEKIGIIKGDKIYYKMEEPRPIVELKTNIVGKIVREEGDIKILEIEVKSGEIDLIRIRKIGKRN
ncbi:MAG: hypothetical protein QXD55_00995 [Candidatus Aenigmatarchaeota archaeon]